MKQAGFEIVAFKTPTLTKVSASDLSIEFSVSSHKYALKFLEDGSARVNGKLVQVAPYRSPVERLKYVDRAINDNVFLPWWLGSKAYAETPSTSLLVERLLDTWNKESNKWLGSRLYDQYVKKDGAAALDAATIISAKQLFSAKDLVGIDVNCGASDNDIYSDTLKEGGPNWICNGVEMTVKNAAIKPRTATLYHEDGHLSQITVGVQHPISLCHPLTIQKMPIVGSVVTVKDGKVSSEHIFRFKGLDAKRLQEKAVLPEERAVAALFQCCKSMESKSGNCFDKIVTAAEKSKLASKGTAQKTLRGDAYDGAR